MWYVTVNGTKMPTPYRTLSEAITACNEYRARLGAGIYDTVFDPQG